MYDYLWLCMTMYDYVWLCRIILCQMSCYICYKLFHKVVKNTTPLFGQVITTKVYTLIHKQTERSKSPQGLRFV